MIGFSTAYSEITLVFFTTLAPSSVMAFIILGAILLLAPLSDEEKAHIEMLLWVPLAITTVGLVASATHLGNSENALYVFMGVGRSPLSNEVFSAVVFLGLAATFWFYTFSLKRKRLLTRIWMLLAMVGGLFFIQGIATTYSVDTIITWDMPFVPLGLWLNALVGGSVLTLCTLRASGCCRPTPAVEKTLIATSSGALAADIVILLLQNEQLASMHNAAVSTVDLIGSYGFFILGFSLLAVMGILILAIPVFRRARRRVPAKGNASTGRASLGWSFSLPWGIVACFLVLGGIFLLRFAFYALHLTVGVGF